MNTDNQQHIMTETTKEFRTEILPLMQSLAKAVAAENDERAAERLHGFLWSHHDQLLALAEHGAAWCENSALEKWFPLTAEEMAALQQRVAALQQAKQAAEAEMDAFMEYHEEEMARIFAIQQAHGTAVMMFRVDRMQFEHVPPARLEELVKLATIQTLEALLAGTNGRAVFDRLTRELVQRRGAQGGGHA